MILNMFKSCICEMSSIMSESQKEKKGVEQMLWQLFKIKLRYLSLLITRLKLAICIGSEELSSFRIVLFLQG